MQPIPLVAALATAAAADLVAGGILLADESGGGLFDWARLVGDLGAWSIVFIIFLRYLPTRDAEGMKERQATEAAAAAERDKFIATLLEIVRRETPANN